MKRFFLLIVSFFIFIAVKAQIKDSVNSENKKIKFEISKDYIADTTKPTIAMFTSSTCMPCRYVKNVLFKKNEYAKEIKEYNLLIFDIKSKEGEVLFDSYVPEQYVPIILFIDRDLNVKDKIGPTDKENFLLKLKNNKE